ncbi:GNAT family N-acetyltransferase [Intestinimonas sp.]|uniref:GNAT family N-acetyltransferase n=1 Tax=Intestinimonas sp. TaxID=1965293 RepID=UPI0026336981|nr:GNAT family N-acetyltransferase [Intestinimonas sp.]
MIEIRPARPEEIPRQKELWKLAFGDDDAYIDYFYAHSEESQVLLLLENGVVWTMVALFPMTVTLPQGETLSSAYIYALATHPDARKKGFGRFILNYVDYYLQESGKDCVTIVPAEPSLYRYFATTGFEPTCSTRKVELLQGMVDPPADGDRIAPVSPADYAALRERLLAGSFRVTYGESLLAYQQGLSRMEGGDLFRLTVAGKEGLAAAEYLDEDTVLVKELLLPPAAQAGGAALLADRMPARRYHLRTPPFWDGLAGSYLQSFAMVKWYRPELAKTWREYRRGYMGLGFD